MQTSLFRQARLSRDSRFDGQFFVAVKTTGIFCRPICPARLPAECNVEYYPLAAQALHAGYRPCLRCRPDSAPGSCAWQGVETTVKRALQLLQQNPALHLSLLAEKLGISPRYLRQLFQQHLGISPKQFQLSQQLLFAKQLLHQTSLPIEHVAQASGFSRARRLQQHMHDRMQLSPSQIRKQRQDTMRAQQSVSLLLPVRAPYNWVQVQAFFAFRAIDGIESVGENYYARYFSDMSYQGWFNATFSPEQQAFNVEIQLNDLRYLHTVVARIRRILDLDANMHWITQALVAAGVPAHWTSLGVQLPGVWQLFEAGCRAIIGQQISVKAAITILNKLIALCGQPAEKGFPSPAAVANANLTELPIPTAKQQCLARFAVYMMKNPDSLPQQWLSLKGIGPWTVAYCAMRGSSNPDIWLETDLVVRKQLQKYAIEPDKARPWRSYLTLALWSHA